MSPDYGQLTEVSQPESGSSTTSGVFLGYPGKSKGRTKRARVGRLAESPVPKIGLRQQQARHESLPEHDLVNAIDSQNFVLNLWK